MGYFKDALKGVSWIGAFRMSTRGISLVRTIILARILTPFYFGIFGIATLVLSFVEILTETGINVVLIQKKEDINKYINTAWVVSIFRGILIAIAIVLLSDPISVFFNAPQAREILILISFVPFVRGFINPSVVKFLKDLQFNKEFWYRFVVFLFDASVALVFSLLWRNAYGLVFGLIAGAILEVILSFIYVKPRPKFILDMDKFREVIGHGKWITGAGIFQFAFRQGDDAVVGRLLGESSLGIYQVAYKISTLPISEVTDVFNKVVLPVYVKISDDQARIRRAFLKTTAVISLLALAMGTAIFLFAPIIVEVVLGEAWIEAIPVLRVLAIFGIVQAITNSGYSLLLSLKKNKTVVMLTFIAILGLAVTIIPLVNQFGIVGAGMSALIGATISLPFMIYSVLNSVRK